jgi:hypothetical protein
MAAAKKVYLTALDRKMEQAGEVAAKLHQYGLTVLGRYWPEQFEAPLYWLDLRDEIIKEQADVWLILLDEAALQSTRVLYGVSQMAYSLNARLQKKLSIMLLSPAALDADKLPTALQAVTALTLDGPWAAKVVARANMPPPTSQVGEYELDFHGNEKLGQWFEFRVADSSLDGVIFGVQEGDDAKINFQAVGASGMLPEKSTLEYAVEDMHLTLGDTNYIAWGLRNRLEKGSSYFARVQGWPRSLIVMPYSDDDESSAWRIVLA